MSLSADQTREIMERVRHIEIRTARLARETFAGQYHSVFKGRGMDFEEVREYVPGDEVRAIDWNVTARTGRPFVKKFREERELTIRVEYDTTVFGTADIAEQGRLLDEVARLVDEGTLKTTLAESFGVISAENLRRAHALIESGRAKGKIVLEGWG